LKKIIQIPDGINLPEQIIGISSQNTDYKVAWEINNILNIELKKYPDKKIEIKDSEDVNLSYYYFKGDKDEKYFILQNSAKGYNLLTKLKNINFFFIILDLSENELGRIQKKLNSSNFFLGCFLISLNRPQINKLKSIIKK